LRATHSWWNVALLDRQGAAVSNTWVGGLAVGRMSRDRREEGKIVWRQQVHYARRPGLSAGLVEARMVLPRHSCGRAPPSRGQVEGIARLEAESPAFIGSEYRKLNPPAFIGSEYPILHVKQTKCILLNLMEAVCMECLSVSPPGEHGELKDSHRRTAGRVYVYLSLLGEHGELKDSRRRTAGHHPCVQPSVPHTSIERRSCRSCSARVCPSRPGRRCRS
jgi:hypothetical protein